MSIHKEQFYVHDATPVGESLLENSPPLQRAIGLYIASVPEAQKAYVPGARLLGAGKYSFTFGLMITPGYEVAVKVSGPATSQEAYETGEFQRPEDLREQFAVMSALRRHLLSKGDGITAPEQYLISHLPGDTFVLVHEYMNGWVSLNERTNAIYGIGRESRGVRHEIDDWTDIFRDRLLDSLGDFELKRRLNDLGGKTGRLHGGNLLVPSDTPLNGDTPLCIIDQPGELAR